MVKLKLRLCDLLNFQFSPKKKWIKAINKRKQTWKHWSVANIFAMEHSVGASGDLASKARAAWRTINRDVTREVAMSASLNWMCCKILFKMSKNCVCYDWSVWVHYSSIQTVTCLIELLNNGYGSVTGERKQSTFL